jgi:hypothetical protein
VRAGGEGPPAAHEDSGGSSEETFWGNELGLRNRNLRVVYNNVNGLQMGNFVTTKIRKEKERKKKGTLSVFKNVTKVARVLSALRRWDANILCCAETQTAWEGYSVRNKVDRELRTQDQYAGMIGSSSELPTCDNYMPGGTLMIYDGNWSGRVAKGVDPH